MRAMVTVVLAVAVALVVAGNVFAKSCTDTQPAPKAHKVEKSLKSLHLTDKQNAEVKTILDQAKKDAGKAKDKEAKAQINKAAYDKIRTTVLTEQQRKQLDEQAAPKACKAGKADKAKTPAKAVKGKVHQVENKPTKV
jgi:hypothetical protein